MEQNNKYWFKAKTYGYGWYPSTWQGWLVIAIYLIIFSILASIFETDIEKYSAFYFISVFVTTGLLVYISYKKGEPARWRWGKNIIKTIGVLLVKDNNVLLVKHNESAGHLNGKYGLPAGRLERGEGKKEAARRELKEETNLDVSLDDLILLNKKWTAKIERKDGDKEFSLRVFYSNNFSGDLKSNEETSPEWISIDEAGKLDLLPNVFDIIKFYQKL